MAEDTEQERFFREMYAEQLRKMKHRDAGSYQGVDELAEERRKVIQQELKTPGRRGEQIKHEEIDKEIVRRMKLRQEQQQEKSNFP